MRALIHKYSDDPLPGLAFLCFFFDVCHCSANRDKLPDNA
jgi:hypothetical protein